MKKSLKLIIFCLEFAISILCVGLLSQSNGDSCCSKKPKYVFYFIGDGMSFNHILGTCGRRVWHGMRGRIVCHEVASSELREVQSFNLALTILHGKELLGTEDMIKAHSITDKVEYIFRLLRATRVAVRLTQQSNA